MSSSVLVHDLQASLAENLPAHTALRGWLAECVQMCRPERVQILDGSSAEKRDLIKRAIAEGVLIRLNQKKPIAFVRLQPANSLFRQHHPKRIPNFANLEFEHWLISML